VLIPVNSDTIAAFGLAADESGVLVLVIQPGGVAENAGIAAGYVISMVHGKAVTDPITLDEILYYWISKDATDFTFDAYRAGASLSSNAKITKDNWVEVIDITTVATWTAYSYESFSYSEFYSEYSSEMTESYASSETKIEESITSEEFTSEETTTEETASDVTDAAAADAADEGTDSNMDTDADGTPDAANTDYDNDGVADTEDSDDNGDGADDSAEGGDE
jgi:hypothetical protein